MRHAVLTLTAVALASIAHADDPEIVDVTVKQQGMGWRVDVTILHADSGWDHYADGWEVLDHDGNRLGFRELRHPHEFEQPFTRSLNSLELPDGTREVFVKSRCSRDGWSGGVTRVELQP